MNIDFSFKNFCEQGGIPPGMHRGAATVDPDMVAQIMSRSGRQLQSRLGVSEEQLEELLTRAPEFMNSPGAKDMYGEIEAEIARDYDLPPGLQMGRGGSALMYILSGQKDLAPGGPGSRGGHVPTAGGERGVRYGDTGSRGRIPGSHLGAGSEKSGRGYEDPYE